MERPKYIASLSFGKDSLAAILLAKEHGEPLDEAVYCEVMFDNGISGEVPEHRDFIYNTAIPALERIIPLWKKQRPGLMSCGARATTARPQNPARMGSLPPA